MQTVARGNVYVWVPNPKSFAGGRVVTRIEPLWRLDAAGKGRLWGQHVRVRNGGEMNEPDPVTGAPHAVPLGDAQPNAEGEFLFEPGHGGERLDKVPIADPEAREAYVQASHFGEVNTYFHIDRIASYINELLAELGSPPLPPVTAVVNAHHAATERDGRRDGVWGTRSPRWFPFQGGHYRLPSWKYDVNELYPLSPQGEIHLGPGRELLQYGALAQMASGQYLHNGSHNAGILYHEYGHHIMRHTSDVRANALRPPDKQSNRKEPIDEGTCDYWAAAMLGTPHIWAWHRRHDEHEIHPRSLASSKTLADYDSGQGADPHLNGTIWAAALWDLRTRLASAEADGSRRADRLVLRALLLLGTLMGRPGEDFQTQLCPVRANFGSGLAALLQADELLASGRHRQTILSCFARRGIHPNPDVRVTSQGTLRLA